MIFLLFVAKIKTFDLFIIYKRIDRNNLQHDITFLKIDEVLRTRHKNTPYKKNIQAHSKTLRTFELEKSILFRKS